MTKTNFIQTVALALNSEGDAVPAWIQLTPEGPNIAGRDGRKWILPNPEAVVAAFNNNGADLPVDFEHATQIKGPKGEAAPAIGWIKDLEVRNSAVWARVEWNEAGQSAITSKGYRYVSPVFTFAKATGDILKMISAGLTNQPNLKLAALNHEGAPEETAMNTAILKALGLKDNASETDVLAAINTMQSDHATALNNAAIPDPGKFVPKADHDLALNRISTFEKAKKETEEVAINTAVDAAIEGGKVAPASRDYHIAACKQDGGLKRFQTMVGASPEIAGKSDLDKKDPAKNKTQLSDEEVAVCKQLGMTEEEFATAKNEE